MSSIPQYRIYTFEDRLHGDADLPERARVGDFWRWAFADLLEDYLKGIFAEWMVGILLGLPLHQERRLEFRRYDHVLPDGRRLEVKATSRWQSWKVLDDHGTLRLKPKKAASVDSQVKFALRSPYAADLYVFCFHTESDLHKWDALDLTQWEFYVLTREQLERLRTRTVTLTRLRELTNRLSARQLQEKLRARVG